jgi:hypothetical protein
MSLLDSERLHERGRALGAWLDAGGSVDRLAALDRAVRRGWVTDWPGREPGEEVRNGIPDLDLAEWAARTRRSRADREPREAGDGR